MANLLEVWERKNDLRAIKEKLDAGRKRESQKAYRQRRKEELEREGKPVKTYAEYLAEDKNRPPSIHLAPAGAVPKHTKGDYPKARIVNKIRLENGDFKVREVPFNKDGSINRGKYNKIRWGGKRSTKLRSIK